MSMKLSKERLYYRCPTPQILMAASVEAPPAYLTEDNVQNAVTKAVSRHALLRCRIGADTDGDAAFLESPSPIPPEILWITDEFDWNNAVSAEEARIFRYEDGELLRFRVYPAQKGIVMLCSANHLVADASALAYLFRDILTALSAPDHSLQEAPSQLCASQKPTAAVKLSLSLRLLLRGVNRQWKKVGKTFSFADYEALFSAYWSKHGTEVLSCTLEPSETAALTDWCQAQGVSVRSALGAAFLLASETSGLGLNVNLREPAYEGMGNYAVGVSVNYFPAADTGFAERVGELHTALCRKLDDPKTTHFPLKMMDSVSPSLLDGAYFAAFGGYVNPIAQKAAGMFGFVGSQRGVNLTHLQGLSVPVTYGACTLHSLAVVPPLVPGYERLVGAVMLNDRLCITMHYDRKRTDEMTECFQKAITTLKHLQV